MNMCHILYILFCREDNVEVAKRLEASSVLHFDEASYQEKDLWKLSMEF